MKNEIIDSFSITEDTKYWFKETGVKFLQEVGIQQGQVILDFGCRIGNYTIPAAISVGDKGKVYALDSNHEAIDVLMTFSNKLGLNNIIVPLKTRGELTIDLETSSVDHVMLYDVIHLVVNIDGSLEPTIKLFQEIQRVLKDGGIFTASFEHLEATSLDFEDIMTVLKRLLSFKRKISTEILHWDRLRYGDIYLFEK
ncbi:MAG: class I SAM-dependent methyltransferase [Candidatus Odinarchaeota archaeon]